MIQLRQAFLLVAGLALVAGAAWSGSLEEARQLIQQGRHVSAAKELQEVIDSDSAGDDEKAQALDLLGNVAVAENDLALAQETWGRLLSDYAGEASRLGVETKLKLVAALMDAREVQPQATQPPGSPQPLPEPSIVNDEPQPPATTPTPEPSTPAPTAAPAPSGSRAVKEPYGLVLVAGGGRPHDAAVEATNGVIENLRELGVNAKSATEGLPVVRDSKSLLPMMVQTAREQGAESILLVKAEFSSRQSVVAECYTPEGAELWKFKVTGGTGVTGREWTPTGINYDLVERFKEKLGKRAGGPGLPTTLN